MEEGEMQGKVRRGAGCGKWPAGELGVVGLVRA